MIKTFGLIGYALSHSFSKKYFTDKFVKENIKNCSYELFPIEYINQLPQLIKDTPNLKGLNVTIPFKQSVIPFLDEIDKTAQEVGAVNCIKIGTKLTGFNTDVYGFQQSIKPFLESHHERALILGTGGASKAVYFVLKQIGIDCFFVIRDKTKCQLATNRVFDYFELNEPIVNSFKLIINTTPLGMYPNTHEYPSIPYKYITKNHLLYDLIYNPTETIFLTEGKKMGATVMNGLSMLHLQAEKAWQIWME